MTGGAQWNQVVIEFLTESCVCPVMQLEAGVGAACVAASRRVVFPVPLHASSVLIAAAENVNVVQPEVIGGMLFELSC